MCTARRRATRQEVHCRRIDYREDVVQFFFFELIKKTVTSVISRGSIVFELIQTVMETNLLRNNLCTITDMFFFC